MGKDSNYSRLRWRLVLGTTVAAIAAAGAAAPAGATNPLYKQIAPPDTNPLYKA